MTHRTALWAFLCALPLAAHAGLHHKYNPKPQNYPVPAGNVIWVATDGTTADKEHGPMRGKDRLRRLPYRRYLIGDLAGISVQFDRLRTAILDFRIEYVLRHIDDNDARTPRPRDIECLFYHARQLVHVLDEVVMLCDRRRNADDVRLLERILSDVRIRDLSRDADHRNGVHMRRRNPRHEIRCPGP